jgi:hypothetical protein
VIISGHKCPVIDFSKKKKKGTVCLAAATRSCKTRKMQDLTSHDQSHNSIIFSCPFSLTIYFSLSHFVPSMLMDIYISSRWKGIDDIFSLGPFFDYQCILSVHNRLLSHPRAFKVQCVNGFFRVWCISNFVYDPCMYTSRLS